VTPFLKVTEHRVAINTTKHFCLVPARALFGRAGHQLELCSCALPDLGIDTRVIQDYLGHRDIQHTVRYTVTNPAQFE
jgi:integrase